MVPGADQSALLCAPECEAPATAGFGRSLGQSQRRFEHCSRAATIVVNTRSLRHAVKMRTNDDQGAIAIKSCVGQHVSSSAFAGHGFTSRRTVAPPRAAMSRERPSSYETPTTGMGARSLS